MQPKSKFPFETKEPENFQCEVVVTANGSTRKTFLARKAGKRRVDFNYGEKNQRAVIQTDKEYLIAFAAKMYAENSPKTGSANAAGEFSELTAELLNRGDHTEFEEVGRENSITKYRSRIADSDTSEIFIYYDETIGLPIKQEFFSVTGDETVLQYSVELVNFRAEADEGLFAIPPGFRKVSLSEFNAAMR